MHLLLCILRNENDPTTKLLTKLNVDYDVVKEIFSQHKQWFPHVRQDYIKRMIASGNLY